MLGFLAVEFGKKRRVIGFDVNANRIKDLQAGHDGTKEVPATELRQAEFLTFTSDSNELSSCGVFIVAVPTPIDRAKRPDLSLLIKACQTVGKAMKPGAVVVFEVDGVSRLHARGLRSHLGASVGPDVQSRLHHRLQP